MTDPVAASPPPPAGGRPGLGIDAGGSQTRWALCSAEGALLGEGVAAGMSALQLGSAAGRGHVAAVLGGIAGAVAAGVAAGVAAAVATSGTAGAAPAPAATAAGAADGSRHANHGALGAVTAGLTGFDPAQAPQLRQLLAAAFALPLPAVQALGDIELVCHAAFAPGGGIVVYAGTGSVAAFLDAGGTLHRAGGRGLLIDDAGGGHWIACRALRTVWRGEDAAPGAWRGSVLARELFAQIGGSDWAASREFVYGQPSVASRGKVGTLALAVAAAADAGDAVALQILRAAGGELARLALALAQRCRPGSSPSPSSHQSLQAIQAIQAPDSIESIEPSRSLPLAFGGRVFALHPAVESGLRAALPPQTVVAGRVTQSSHHAAALLAARMTRTETP